MINSVAWYRLDNVRYYSWIPTVTRLHEPTIMIFAGGAFVKIEINDMAELGDEDKAEEEAMRLSKLIYDKT